MSRPRSITRGTGTRKSRGYSTKNRTRSIYNRTGVGVGPALQRFYKSVHVRGRKSAGAKPVSSRSRITRGIGGTRRVQRPQYRTASNRRNR